MGEMKGQAGVDQKTARSDRSLNKQSQVEGSRSHGLRKHPVGGGINGTMV